VNNWYYIGESIPGDPFLNMAIDEFLFLYSHRKKIGVLRTYSWECPTFSIGVSQKIDKVLDVNFVKTSGFKYVRRITGGKTVLHDNEITYSIVSSEDMFFKENDLYKSYELIAGVLLETLKLCGIDAYLSKGSPSHLSKSSNPCFSFPTPNEIEVDGKKIIGSAQKRDKFALLQHGSIPFGMNYSNYSKGARFKESLLKKSMITISSVSDISKVDFVKNLMNSFENFLSVKFKKFEFKDSDIIEIEKLRKKYESFDWNHIL